MKRLIPIIVIIAFLACSMVSSASYLVQLKNGGKFITYHYWEEGNQIKFYIYGGVMGINKDFVKEIKESDLLYREETVELQIPKKEILSNKDKTEKNLIKKDIAKDSKTASEDNHYRKEIERLKEQSKKVWDDYNKLTEDGLKAERDEARKRAFEIDLKLQELTRKSLQSRIPPSGNRE